MKYTKFFLSILIVLGLLQSSFALTIHTIGDSTAADYDENTSEIRGWAMMFKQFITNGATVNNRAKSGASSKSFYLEAPYWTTVKKQIQAGDYVFIQFAHNDEKNNGLDGDSVRATTDPNADYRGTTAQGTFKFYLRAYVNETRALGATPVLLTSMCRKYFSNGKITRIGRHDLGEKFGVGEDNHNYDYAYATIQVAQEMSVQLIDLTSLTKSLFESYGDAACTALLFNSADGTHPNAMGGTLVARLCAQDMVRQNILTEYVNTSADVLVNPTEGLFGEAYVGQTLTKEFTLSGFDLNPASGTFTISTSEGFLVSKTKTEDFGPSVTCDYSDGNLNFTRFFVRTQIEEDGEKAGTLTLSNGTVTKTISLSAQGIQLSGGTEVKLFWELSANSDYSLTGPATAIEESWSTMYVQRYAAPNSAAVWPAESGYTAARVTQRNLLVGDAWPAGEIDEVSTRFIQFGITPNTGNILNIDSIGLYICGAGGNGMRCRISYSTDRFANRKVIGEYSSMTANTIYAVSAIPVVKLTEGDTLLLRVYPWYNGAATGKTICLADVCIHGLATSGNWVNEQTRPASITFRIVNRELRFDGIEKAADVNIFTSDGQRIATYSFEKNSSLSLPVPENKGVYLVRVNAGNQQHVEKFIVR